MKRKLLLIFLAILMLSVIACERVEAKQLSAPEVEVFDNRIEWSMDTLATSYEIVTDKTIVTTNTVFYFGDYFGIIKVKCLGDGDLYSDSDYTIVEI